MVLSFSRQKNNAAHRLSSAFLHKHDVLSRPWKLLTGQFIFLHGVCLFAEQGL
jgi:hypothetical protein